jgi:hypothetical protein
MKLVYTGLKPVVNAHGISFKEGKEDKFIYLPFAVDILNAINHDYEQKRVYSHELNNKVFTPSEIIDTIMKFHPDFMDSPNNSIIPGLENYNAESEQPQTSHFRLKR